MRIFQIEFYIDQFVQNCSHNECAPITPKFLEAVNKRNSGEMKVQPTTLLLCGMQPSQTVKYRMRLNGAMLTITIEPSNKTMKKNRIYNNTGQQTIFLPYNCCC